MGRIDKATQRADARKGHAAMTAAMKARDGDTFVAIPHVVLASQGWRLASRDAKALLLDMAAPLYLSNKAGARGLPNGGLMVERSRLAALGWTSVGTLDRALRDLLACGLLVKTRQGGKNRPSLYAVTWHGLSVREPDYQRAINPALWDKAHRGGYLRPEKMEKPPQVGRTMAASLARRAAAEARRSDLPCPCDGGQSAPIRSLDGQQEPPTGPSGGPIAAEASHTIGPSGGHSLEHRHLLEEMMDRAQRESRRSVVDVEAVLGCVPQEPA